ncbi:hypothetical protein KBD45_00950 [Candidatus Dojkabacteria bacterium]|nr:hypothetical protein [Candidatus Dojkabacteria bacterium]
MAKVNEDIQNALLNEFIKSADDFREMYMKSIDALKSAQKKYEEDAQELREKQSNYKTTWHIVHKDTIGKAVTYLFIIIAFLVGIKFEDIITFFVGK